MTKTKRAYFVLLSIFLSVQVWSFELALADIYQYSPDGESFTVKTITEDLYKSLRKTDREGVLSLSEIKGGGIPKSILDAAALSERKNLNYLLYGFLKVTESSYDFEVKLYDREAGEIQKVFYAKESLDNYGDLVETMSRRITGYLYKTLGVTRRKEAAEKERGVMDIESGLGWWIPFNPWAEVLMGLGSFHVSGNLTPLSPLFTWDIYGFTPGYGISLEYAPGMNREGYESSFFHTIRFGFPVTLSVLWHYRNRVNLQLAPELQVDVLVQDRLYGSVVNKTSAAFSLGISAGYEYLFTGSRFSAGFAVRFHTAFYKTPLFSAEPCFYGRYRFHPASKGGRR